MKRKLFLLSIFFFLTLTSPFAQEEKKACTFEDLKTALLSNNPELLKLNEELIRAKLDLKDARANFGPTVDLQLTGTYLANPPIDAVTLNAGDFLSLLSFPQGINPSAGAGYITLYEGMENTLYNAELTLQQPLFTWGKIYNATRLYKKIADAKELQLISTQKQQETELETRLASLYYLEKIKQILTEERDYADRLVSFSETAEKTGMLLHQDVLDAKMQAKQLEIAERNLDEQVNSQLIELEKLTRIEGLSLEQIDYEFDSSVIEEVMALNRSEVEAHALSSTQDSIQLLTLVQEVSEIATKISKDSVNWKPDLALQVSLGYGGSRFPLLEENWLRKDDWMLNLSVGLKTSVWDGGKKVRDVSRKASEERTAQINKEDARATIRHTLEQQWNTADVCTMRMDYQDLKIETCELKIQQQEVIYNSGYGSESDLLTAKIDWCNERIEKEKQALSLMTSCLTIRYLSK